MARLTIEEVSKFKKQYSWINGGERAVKNSSVMDLINTIEAQQQEIDKLQERISHIFTRAQGIIRDRAEGDKVLIMAEEIITWCGNVGDKMAESIVRQNRKLQQENKQLRHLLDKVSQVLQDNGFENESKAIDAEAEL